MMWLVCGAVTEVHDWKVKVRVVVENLPTTFLRAFSIARKFDRSAISHPTHSHQPINLETIITPAMDA
jgi:hypothetical protein